MRSLMPHTGQAESGPAGRWGTQLREDQPGQGAEPAPPFPSRPLPVLAEGTRQASVLDEPAPALLSAVGTDKRPAAGQSPSLARSASAHCHACPCSSPPTGWLPQAAETGPLPAARAQTRARLWQALRLRPARPWALRTRASRAAAHLGGSATHTRPSRRTMATPRSPSQSGSAQPPERWQQESRHCPRPAAPTEVGRPDRESASNVVDAATIIPSTDSGVSATIQPGCPCSTTSMCMCR